MKNIREIILDEIRERKKITSGQLAELTGVSRQAAHGHLSDLVKAKKLIKIGSTRGSYYVPFSPQKAKEIEKGEEKYYARLKRKELEEDRVYDRIKRQRAFIRYSSQNIQSIIHYTFTEMLNNAIEHSGSLMVSVTMETGYNSISFNVVDQGIGIFKHVQKKFNLKDEYEALEEILKGKRTTMPDKHTGEGIFFTSKIADIFQIESAKIKLVIDNQANDIYVKEIPRRKGTKVFFQIKKRTKKNLRSLFARYTDKAYRFQKTKVMVRLYEKGVEYVSRSQARRLIFGLDRFRIIILDFDRVKSVGQGFVDEIFRVFQKDHPDITIEPINCCRAVDFMIKRIKG